MSTFYQGTSDIQTLYLMNPNFAIPYSPDAPHFISDDSSNNLSTIDRAESVITGSKYLKAVRELLDEVASVGKKANRDKAKMVNELTTTTPDRSNGGRPELTTTQRQDIQMKKSTLNIMLDEVEQRCKQYHQQMQMIEASFERVAGAGSAKPYTHLARKTITRHFSRLKTAISAQTKALGKTLGEEENESRLRFVDRHLRMMQPKNNGTSWRPQRCLPEKAVLLLRAWLFGHFLHPYPKDSDKQMLAKQTGLTRSQVSNWFINARVRLWKPMVEDMYLEETTKTHQEHISPNDNMIKIKTDGDCMDTKSSNLRTMQTTKRHRYENQYSSPSRILSEQDMERGVNDNITFISANQGQSMGNYLSSSGYDSTYGISVVESGHPRQIPTSFQGNNNFSLSLALPPSETYSRKSSFLSHGNFEFGTRIEAVNGIEQAGTSHPNVGNFEILDFQLLHDHRFVA